LAAFTNLESDEVFQRDAELFAAEETKDLINMSLQSEEAISNSEDFHITTQTKKQQK
jgi:hypothetical protein